MSTESRLKRLGFYHLKDKPQELQQGLARQIREDEEKVHQRQQKQQERRVSISKISPEMVTTLRACPMPQWKTVDEVLPPGYCLEDRFYIESVLGKGSFGVTYKAMHRFLGSQLAIKEYFPKVFSYRDAGNVSVHPNTEGQKLTNDNKQNYYTWGLTRFLDEARILQNIEHPNVVRVKDVFLAHGTAYIVMDYEEGEPLSSLLERVGTLPEDRVLRLLNEILEALETVHARGYLHRDLKPENIYLRIRDGCSMLIDFGAARQALLHRDENVTGLITPGYSPLEQYATCCGHYYGPWTDIYALGAVIYQCITGQRPMEAPDRLLGEREGMYMNSAAKLGRNGYGSNLLFVVDRALAIEPQQRFQNVMEVRAALEDLRFPLASFPSLTSGIETLLPGIKPELSPLTLDENIYTKAKPHFQAAWDDFRRAGKDARDFIRFILDHFDAEIKPYLMRFVQDQRNASSLLGNLESNRQGSKSATRVTEIAVQMELEIGENLLEMCRPRSASKTPRTPRKAATLQYDKNTTTFSAQPDPRRLLAKAAIKAGAKHQDEDLVQKGRRMLSSYSEDEIRAREEATRATARRQVLKSFDGTLDRWFSYHSGGSRRYTPAQRKGQGQCCS